MATGTSEKNAIDDSLAVASSSIVVSRRSLPPRPLREPIRPRRCECSHFCSRRFLFPERNLSNISRLWRQKDTHARTPTVLRTAVRNRASVKKKQKLLKGLYRPLINNLFAERNSTAPPRPISECSIAFRPPEGSVSPACSCSRGESGARGAP